MTNFEFVFSLFGLLLGFSLAEVIAGFGRAVEAKIKRPRFAPVAGEDGAGEGEDEAEAPPPVPRIGWLTPLLGLFVIFNLLSFWTAAWALRDQIPVLYLPMLFGLLVTGGYYFAAAMVFPRAIGEGTDLDDHYFAVKRWVVAVVTGCNLLGTAGTALTADPFAVTGAAVTNLVFYALLVALFFARGRLVNLILLVAAAAAYPMTAVLAAVTW